MSRTALEKAFEEIYSSLPELLCSDIEKPSPFPTNKKVVARELEEKIFSLRQKCQDGLQHILDQIGHKEPEKAQEISQLLHEKFDSILTHSMFTFVVLKVVSGQSWREAFSISTDLVDTLYESAKTIFEEGLFQEAASCFTFLSWFDSKEYSFWMALGHSHFHSAEHLLAIKAYVIASQTCPEEAWPHLYSALCFEALGNPEEAAISIQEGIEKAKQHGDKKLILDLQQKLKSYKKEPVEPIS